MSTILLSLMYKFQFKHTEYEHKDLGYIKPYLYLIIFYRYLETKFQRCNHVSLLESSLFLKTSRCQHMLFYIGCLMSIVSTSSPILINSRSIRPVVTVSLHGI